MIDNYTPPNAELSESVRSVTKTTKALAFISTCVACVVVIGIAQAVQVAINTYESVQIFGAGDSTLLASGTAHALSKLIAFGIFGSVGLIISLFIIMTTNYRARWFFIATSSLSVLHLAAIPIGTIVGTILIVVLFIKRGSFKKLEIANVEPQIDT